jgi:DNA-binding response OmpR family regulator
MRNNASSIRNPNAEIRKKAEIRIANPESSDCARFSIRGFGLRISFGFRISAFGLNLMNPRILIIEDERPMRTALQDCLAAEGYRVLTAADGETGFAKAIEEKPDLILLDLMMPRLDGYTLCAELRRLGHTTPVLMLTAKGLIQDRVRGLDVGADDYLVKPFSTEELLARIRAVLRRSRRSGAPPPVLVFGDVRVDLPRQKAWCGAEEIHFTPKEFAMLRLLSESAGEPVSRERFLDVVWSYTAFPTTRTVDNHIASLRAKIEPDPEKPRWIKTVHGVGYRMEEIPGVSP